MQAEELLASIEVLRSMDNQLNFVSHAKGRTVIGEGWLRTEYWREYLDVTGNWKNLQSDKFHKLYTPKKRD
jgi:hypothetical protein